VCDICHKEILSKEREKMDGSKASLIAVAAPAPQPTETVPEAGVAAPVAAPAPDTAAGSATAAPDSSVKFRRVPIPPRSVGRRCCGSPCE
jgi:hypothetical protein